MGSRPSGGRLGERRTLRPEPRAQRLFDAEWLDVAVADRPVVLQATDHHCAWVNTAALRLAGVDEHTPDPPAAAIARRADGTPMGTLVEWTAMDLVLRHTPSTDGGREGRRGWPLHTMLAAPASRGRKRRRCTPTTSVYLETSGAVDWRFASTSPCVPSRGEWPAQRASFAARARLAARSAMVSARTVKFFADGVVEAGTAALLAPYTDRPHSCGLPVWSRDELAAAAAAFDADGFRLHIHAIGDAGVRNALDAIEHVARVNGVSARRPVIAHTQLVDPVDLPRFAALGVIANVEPLWAQLDPLQLISRCRAWGPLVRRCNIRSRPSSRPVRCSRWAATGRSARTGRSTGWPSR